MEILIVEDDPDIQFNLRTFLGMQGHSVLSAANGAEALEILHSGRRPRLILLDLMMPIMTGYEFLDRLRDEPPGIADIPVILLSAATDVESTARQRVLTFLRKPFSLDVLLRAIQSV